MGTSGEGMLQQDVVVPVVVRHQNVADQVALVLHECPDLLCSPVVLKIKRTKVKDREVTTGALYDMGVTLTSRHVPDVEATICIWDAGFCGFGAFAWLNLT